MKVKWLGHACFLLVSDGGFRIITDPYAVEQNLNYSPIKEAADVVVVSHDHYDHNNVSAVWGEPEVLKGSGVRIAKGIQFRGIATYHDTVQGEQRGANTVFCFRLDEMNLCHLGDLGHVLSAGQVEEIGDVDILFTPVGGFYTIDAAAASQVCDQLKPKVVIPMHFRTPQCTYPIAGIDDFLRGKVNVKKIDLSEVEFRLEKLPRITEIVILEPVS
ncbi:MAG: MBL fold metallo-hydrolase [Dehalococcoidia bacterium]|nr:MBL fold metallo-hydrolase [Dehalococcoidia bacterium]